MIKHTPNVYVGRSLHVQKIPRKLQRHWQKKHPKTYLRRICTMNGKHASRLNKKRLGAEVRFMQFTDDHCYYYGPGKRSGKSGKYTWTLKYK